MLPSFSSCTITEFCVTSSLAIDNWGQKYCETLGNKPNPSIPIIDWYLWSRGKTFTPCAARTITFQRKNFNYLIVCFTQCTLFFQYVCFLLPICLPCVICGTYVTRINAVSAVSWHIARQTSAYLGLFTFARIACLLQLWNKITLFGPRPSNNFLYLFKSTSWFIKSLKRINS